MPCVDVTIKTFPQRYNPKTIIRPVSYPRVTSWSQVIRNWSWQYLFPLYYSVVCVYWDSASTQRRGNLWQRSFIFTVRPTVHSNPSENGAFPKSSSNRRKLKTQALRYILTYTENVLKMEFWWRHDNHVTEISTNSNIRSPVIAEFPNSSSVAWTENIWCVFRVKPLFLIAKWQI